MFLSSGQTSIRMWGEMQSLGPYNWHSTSVAGAQAEVVEKSVITNQIK